MGFLTMIGAVSAEEHARLIKQARDEEAQTITSLKSQLSDAQRGFVDQQAKAKKAETALDEAKVAYDNESASLRTARDEIKGLRAQLCAAEEVIADIKPDAQKWRDLADRERARGEKEAA